MSLLDHDRAMIRETFGGMGRKEYFPLAYGKRYRLAELIDIGFVDTNEIHGEFIVQMDEENSDYDIMGAYWGSGAPIRCVYGYTPYNDQTREGGELFRTFERVS